MSDYLTKFMTADDDVYDCLGKRLKLEGRRRTVSFAPRSVYISHRIFTAVLGLVGSKRQLTEFSTRDSRPAVVPGQPRSPPLGLATQDRRSDPQKNYGAHW